MKQIQTLIHRKENQYRNPAYSLNARKAIEYELNQLKEIKNSINDKECKKKELLKELNNYKNRIFHFELLTTALLRTSPTLLGTYLNIYSIPTLMAYFKNTTPTLKMCEQLESEIIQTTF